MGQRPALGNVVPIKNQELDQGGHTRPGNVCVSLVIVHMCLLSHLLIVMHYSRHRFYDATKDTH